MDFDGVLLSAENLAAALAECEQDPGCVDAATLEQGHKITMAVVRRLETVVTDLRQMG